MTPSTNTPPPRTPADDALSYGRWLFLFVCLAIYFSVLAAAFSAG